MNFYQGNALNKQSTLDPYYSRHDLPMVNQWKRKRRIGNMTIITAIMIMFAVALTLIAHSCSKPPLMLPATQSEKQSMRDHVLATVTADEMRLYEYYRDRQ